jgi:Putative prokaryotic signal transducing protein
MKLTTVNAFYDPNQARIALNLLESEGVRGVLENENITHNALVLGQAVGCVRLMVEDRDVERARDILGDDSTLEPSELDELALQAQPEEPAKPLFKFFYPDEIENENDRDNLDSTKVQSGNETTDTYVTDPNSREIMVERAFRGSILFLVLSPFVTSFLFLIPIVFLITALLLQILLSEERLRPKFQRKLVLALVFHLPVLLLVLWIARNLFQSLLVG